MDHNHMNHTGMNHDHMDHGHMNHDHMDHGHMDHSSHGEMDHSSGHMDHAASGHMDHSGHSMMMYFHFGYEEMILFKFWDTSSVSGFIFSIVGIFLIAVLYEGLKYLREFLIMKSYEALKYSSMTSMDRNTSPDSKKKIRLSMMSTDHCLQTILHLIQVVVSYCLMLIFMTYNVWLCLAVAVGSAVGYFLFGWRKSSVVDITEHCH